jgi:hypothetical protein
MALHPMPTIDLNTSNGDELCLGNFGNDHVDSGGAALATLNSVKLQQA